MPNYIDILRDHTSSEAGDGAETQKRNLLSTDTISAAGRRLDSGNIIDFYKLAGEQSVTKLEKIMHQDFGTLKDICSKNKILFEDTVFPAVGSSLGDLDYVRGPIKWLRPSEIVKPFGLKPKFFVDGPSRFDINQGRLGDCWLVAAFATLAMNEDLLNQVVPEGQSFQDDYAGIFHFRFWRYGKWVDVVVDDYLPTTSSYDNPPELLFAKSAAQNEFWPALLEKAYAKLHGSYEALSDGYMSEAMTDFTGGLSEMYIADLQRSVITYDILFQAWEKKSLITCSFRRPPLSKDEKINVNRHFVKDMMNDQLPLDHAYSITHVTQVTRVEDEVKIPLLRIRNPWGSYIEWSGAWSDGSKEWDSVSEEEKKRLDFEKQARGDGEFWMSFEDFKRHLETVEICHLNLNQFSNSVDKKEWEISEFEGAWVRGATAGGCKCDLEMFELNPQYRMTIEKESTVIVELMQKNRRTQKWDHGYHKIGISIYSLKDNPSENLKHPLDSDFFLNAKAMHIDSFISDKSVPQFIQFASGSRSVSCRLKLTPGVYWIIPNALRDDMETEFLLRVFSDNPNTVEEYDQKLCVQAIEDVEGVHGVELDGTDYARGFLLRNLIGNDWAVKVILDSMISRATEHKKTVISARGWRSIVKMLNRNGSETLDLNEIETYWKRMLILIKVFIAYCKADDGLMDAKFLRKALNKAGYFLDNRMLSELVRRYAPKKDATDIGDFFIYAIEVEKKYEKELSGSTKLASPVEENHTDVSLQVL